MLEVKVREFRHSDYDSYATIHNALDPTHPLLLERAKYEDSCFGRTKYRMKRYVAESDKGEIIGVSDSSICSSRTTLIGSPSRSRCIQLGSAAASVDCSTSASS